MTPAALFPAAATTGEFAAVREDERLLRPGVDAICARHGIAASDVVRFAGGSLPVYGAGAELVLKLYPPCHRSADFEVERLALAVVRGRLPVPTPAVEASGDLDGWSYILMTRLRGQLLTEAWPAIRAPERERLAADLGACMAALHAIDTAGLDALRPDWPDFLREQRRTCVARQESRGLARNWLEQIPDFLDRVHLDERARPVLLHTELMREHLLVTGGPDGWALSGLFDFEPAMVGAAEYDLASVGVFVTCGEAALLRALLQSYGYRDDALDAGLSGRCMAYALLHRFSNLAWYLDRVPPPPAASTLEALAAHFWRL